MQIVAIVVSIAIAAVGIALFARAIGQIIGVIRLGAPIKRRTDNPGRRVVTLLKETLGHTRMLQWTWVGIGHWFVFVGFGLLFFTLVTAFGQLFDPHFAIPLLGHFFLFEWVTELFTLVMVIAILAFIGYRATRPKERVRGTDGRFYGSTMWQGYFVEFVILGVGLCIGILRGLEYAIAQYGDNPDYAGFFHFPIFGVLGEAFSGMSENALANAIYLVAMIKIVISFTWMITISLVPTMGVAWHRFLAFFNIYFRREADGSNALGAVRPMTSGGEIVDFEDLEDLDEDTALGVGKVEEFAWKGILDFSTCTECGRCQSQCPAWNTDKPLSPKLLVLGLRDHAYAKAPYLQAGGEGSEAATALLEKDEALAREAERPLVGDTGDDWFYMPDSGAAVIDDDVLWSCTTCGACVQQCPVDIEHVDHIVDMRRYQILVESNFPAELNGLFKGLENKGNPWNMNPNGRLEWAQGLDFDVKVVGEDVETLDEVEWLFWVGCAGAYEDRAKKTTRAVAELLNMAGVDFAVLGNGETCNGDPARRAGNEFVFQGLATQNAEVLKETKAKKVVATCAHCFNTLKNEYSQFGVELEVVHHTQLLNRLVREKKLTPVAAQGASRSITYHDPCYLGRHNQVYSPPRELLQVIPGAEYKEMPRNSERSFCCGAGGARMWMEETIGERINRNRTKEAVETGADQIAVGCPFCRVMLSDGLVAEQQDGNAREDVEVLDVAQMLLASVKGEVPKKTTARAGAGAAGAGAAAGATSSATAAEPSAGDATQTEDTVTDTADAGPAAKASGGTSLFDTPAQAEPEPTTPAEATPKSEGGSLFDLGKESDSPAASEAPAAPADSKPDLGSGGSLFDLGGATEPAPSPSEPEAKAAPEPETAPEAKAEPAADLGSGGSLFDIAPTEPPAPAEKPAAAKEAPPAAEEKPAAKPASAIPEDGSLFDIATPEPAPEPAPEAKAEPAADAAPEPAVEAEKAEAEKAEPEQRAAQPEPSSSGSTSVIPEGGSLFDIKAAVEESSDAADSGAASAVTSTEAPTEDAPAGETTEASAAEQEEAEEAQDKEEDKPRPSSFGEAHQPKTDTDISGAGSLFDL